MLPLVKVTAPIVSLKVPILNVPPATDNAPHHKPIQVVSAKVPVFTVVNPVYKLAPDKVNVPLPSLINAPDVFVLAPEIVRLAAPFVTLIVLFVNAVKV